MSTSQIIHGHELEFDEGRHAYRWNGAFVPGVTTVLSCIAKPALIQWSAGMASDYWRDALAVGRTDYSNVHKEAKTAHRRKAQAAADAGTNVHAYAECFFKNLPLPELLTDQAKLGVEAFHKWLDAHHVEILASERRVFSKEFFYAGTCDFVAKVDGMMGVGDIKTSSGIYPEMYMQVAAYQHALQEEKGIEFPVRLIVRFDKKTGAFETKHLYDFERDFAGFCAALNLHKSLQLMEQENKIAKL